ncbi:MAG: response regulator [Gammaproteobacteria bacterium]|nr:response regulator [Gammaproteobacteria bacterium]
MNALVVDDDDFVRGIVVGQLRALGAGPVEEAADAPTAQSLLRRGTAFDLIVSDLKLPGVEFLRGLAEAQPGAAVILMSRMDEGVLRSVAVMARERGLRVLGALRKPVRLEALRELLVRRETLADARAGGTPAAVGRAELERALERRARA